MSCAQFSCKLARSISSTACNDALCASSWYATVAPLHARIAIGEALFCLAVHHYSTCNFLKPTISRGLSIGKLERCLKLHTVKDVLSAFVLSQLNILARPAQPLDVRAAAR
jgi:hypothetical protein